MLYTTNVDEAAQALKNGGIVIFPTETVYGIGANAYNAEGVRTIYRIKNRPLDNPPIVHVESWNQAKGFVHWNKWANAVAEAFNKGPITLILPKKEQDIFSAGLETLALRVPAHDTAQALLRTAKLPVAAPSANLSTRPSGTRVHDIYHTFVYDADVFLSGREPYLGVESSVVDLTKDRPRLLRPGYIAKAQLEEVLHTSLTSHTEPGEVALSPGIKYKHYAPTLPVYIVESMANVPIEGYARVGFSLPGEALLDQIVKNNREYMQVLYAFFYEAERAGARAIYCEHPQQDEYEETLLNRLEKAAYTSGL